MSRFRLIGVAENPQQIADTLNTRRVELGLTMAELNEALGFAGNYAHKIFARGYNKNLGRESMPAMLAATGCKIAIILDEEAELPAIIRRAISERTIGAGNVSVG